MCPMKILITAGGTSEKIDEVRKITNMATGRLGALIADEFVKKANGDITYICSENAIIPSDTATKTIRIGTVNELLDTLTTLLAQNKYTAVIHAMAVSDYTLHSVLSVDDLSSSISETIYENRQSWNNPDSLADIIKTTILQSPTPLSSHKKISSDIANLALFMGKTPKVINRIKQLQPETILVGFKLLADVSEDALLHTGHELLVKNNCDFVLANDLKQVQTEAHQGILIKPDRTFQRLHSKQEIAEAIVNNVLTKFKENNK